jgi:Iron-sulfur cluster-binding domain
MVRTLEFTTGIGCTVNCERYCSWKITAEHYDSNITLLSTEAFAKFLSTVPLDTLLIFAGVSEPFLNPACTDMILHAHRMGYRIRVFTTLTGLKREDAVRLVIVPFESFILHMPDACGNANIAKTHEWHNVLDVITGNVKNLFFMSMNETFVSDCSEKIARGEQPILHTCSVTCQKLKVPEYIVLPNGNVYFCCMTKGITECIGNMHTDSYADLVARLPENAYRMQHDPTSICHRCTVAVPMWYDNFIELKEKVFGRKMITEMLQGK